MDYQAMYAAKLTDKETAMNLVRSHDRIMVYGGANVFLTSLCERSGSLEGVELYSMFMLNQDYPFLRGETEGRIDHYGTFLSPPMRKAQADGSLSRSIRGCPGSWESATRSTSVR